MVAVVRYDAIGSVASQLQVVHSCLVRWRVRTPFATASSPAGTVIWKL
jgi:hypothetical protein